MSEYRPRGFSANEDAAAGMANLCDFACLSVSTLKGKRLEIQHQSEYRDIAHGRFSACIDPAAVKRSKLELGWG